MNVKKSLNKMFSKYYLTGYYSSNYRTEIIIAYGWLDMQLKLFLLRLECVEVVVI